MQWPLNPSRSYSRHRKYSRLDCKWPSIYLSWNVSIDRCSSHNHWDQSPHQQTTTKIEASKSSIQRPFLSLCLLPQNFIGYHPSIDLTTNTILRSLSTEQARPFPVIDVSPIEWGQESPLLPRRHAVIRPDRRDPTRPGPSPQNLRQLCVSIWRP
jgi:hypothetical protein